MHGGSEEAEVDGAIDAELLETGVVGEVVLLAMLKDEKSVGGKPIGIEHQRRQFGELRECVGWIGKDKLERLGRTSTEITKDIATNQLVIGARDVQLLGYLLDELLLGTSHLDTNNRGGSTTEQFETDTASAAEEVECAKPFEIYPALQNVEEGLFGQIGCGTSLQIVRRIEPTAAILAGDNFHYWLRENVLDEAMETGTDLESFVGPSQYQQIVLQLVEPLLRPSIHNVV